MHVAIAELDILASILKSDAWTYPLRKLLHKSSAISTPKEGALCGDF